MSQQHPVGWSTACLADLLEPDRTLAYGVLKPGTQHEGGVRLLKGNEVRDGFIELREDARISPELDEEFSRTRLRGGEILLTVVGSVGRSAVVPPSLAGANVSRAIAVLPVRREHAKWIQRALQSPAIRRMMEERTGGSAQPVLNLGEVREFVFPLPPLGEQERIIAKLESLLARSRRAREALDSIPALLERFRQSVLAAAFRGDLTRDWREKNPDVEPASKLLERIRAERRRRWEEAELERMRARGKPPKDEAWKARYEEPARVDHGELPELPDGWAWAPIGALGAIETGFTPPTSDEYNFGGTLPFFKPSDLDQGYWVHEAREHLSERGAERGRMLPADSVLVTCIGATIGKTGLARIPCATNQQINAVVPDKGIDPRWLFWALSSPDGQDLIRSNASATTLPILNKGRFSALRVPLPPEDEQIEIAIRIEARLRTDAISDALAASLEKLDALEASLLTRAFRGELVPQDPSDEPASVLLERIRAEREASQASAATPKRRTKKAS